MLGTRAQKDALSHDKTSFLLLSANLKLHSQGVADAVEGVVDLLAEGGHDCDYDDSDEGENDRVLNQTLTFFFGSE
jgi:hypothetical protein